MTINQWGIYIYIYYIYPTSWHKKNTVPPGFSAARSFAALGAAGVCGGSQADPDVVDPNASNAVPGERQLERTEGTSQMLGR